MNTNEQLSDEVLAAAFRQRAGRGDPGDLHQRILAGTAQVAQQRSWRSRALLELTRPTLRLAWLVVLLVATLLAAALAVGVSKRLRHRAIRGVPVGGAR